MQVKEFIADGTPQHIEIQTNTSSLHLTIINKFTKDDITADAESFGSREKAILENVLGNLRGLVSIGRYSNNGTKMLVQNIQLNTLIEISAFGRSVVRHQEISAPGAASVVIETKCIILLSNYGAIRADKTNFLILDYTNPIQADQRIMVDSVSSYMSYNEWLGIDTLTTQDNQTTNFDCETAYLLIVPTGTDKLRVDCKAGDTLELTKRELASLQLMTTDDIHICNGKLLPSVNWNAVDVAQAYRGELLTPSKSNFYLLANKSY